MARITGTRNYPTAAQGGNIMTPVEVYYDVEYRADGKVLGAATSVPVLAEANSCTPLITTYLRRGGKNNATEVKKLQQFLATDPSLYPKGLVTGVYGPLTVAAVSNFQTKYKADILTPLGLKGPTGSVLGATQRKINEVACATGAPLAAAVPAVTENPAPTTPTAPVAPAKPKTPVVVAPPVPPANVVTVEPQAKPEIKLKSWLNSLVAW